MSAFWDSVCQIVLALQNINLVINLVIHFKMEFDETTQFAN